MLITRRARRRSLRRWRAALLVLASPSVTYGRASTLPCHVIVAVLSWYGMSSARRSGGMAAA